MAFITARRSRRTNYIGIPGTSTFGVGLADEKDYTAVGLKPTAHCFDPTDFQYGQYYFGEDTSQGVGTVDMKWIPKFYIKQLQKNEGTVNLDDGELEALLPYVEVTKEQMKEAQRRSPHNALVVAPADRFANEADANAHGFYLMRGFIDGGKEYNGFFIANALTTYGNVGSEYFLCLGQRGFRNGWTKPDSPLSSNADLTNKSLWPHSSNDNTAKGNFISTLTGTNYRCCSGYAWAVISILSLIQGQYATNTNDCAWYDTTLVKNYPKGINKNGLTDCDDPDVTLNPSFTAEPNVFVDDILQYNKTTHNGSANGITNVNGWLFETLIGVWGNFTLMLKRSASIYDITSDNVDNKSASYYELQSGITVSKSWSGNKSSLPDLAGNYKNAFGLCPIGKNQAPENSNEFGKDEVLSIESSTIITAGSAAYYPDGINAGIFNRRGDYWTRSYEHFGFRAMAYPRETRTSSSALRGI